MKKTKAKPKRQPAAKKPEVKKEKPVDDLKLTAALMVKDEEKNLPRCLQSIVDFGVVDEIVIVDTGSTDRTVEIAESFGAEVVIPENLDEYFVDHKFGRDLDFSKARNFTIKEAEKRGADWLFLIDADEEIKGTGKNLKPFLKQLKPDVEGVAVVFEDMQGGKKVMQFPPARIFRRKCIKFENIIHNRQRFKEPAIMFPEIKILHYGYDYRDDPAQEERKRNRTLGMLLKQLEMDGRSHWTYFYLAQIYGQLQDMDRCIEYAVKYIRQKDNLERFNPSIYYTLVQACTHAKKMEIADLWLAEAIDELPEDIDIATAIVDYGLVRKKAHLVLEGCKRYLTAFEKMKKNLLNSGSRFVYNFNDETRSKILFHLAFIRIGQGKEYIEELMQTLPTLPDQETAEKIRVDAERAFERVGIGWHHNDKEDDEPKEQSEAI